MANKTTIEAGGGVVLDPRGRVLMILRGGRWDLPKGKREAGESIEACAVREVEEECGVSGLEVTGAAGTTEHTYELEGVEVLKRTYWYTMRCGGGLLTPQVEEGIERAEWVSINEVKGRMEGIYPTIRELLERVFGL